MNMEQFRRKWLMTLKHEIKDYDDRAEHDLDFAISFKDAAYQYYRAMLNDLRK